jgi:membrane-associated phospholipid phosphatase
LAFAIALVVTTAISALVPAVGLYDAKHFANPNLPFTSEAFLEHLRDFPAVRDGSLRTMDLVNLTGIVTFPSFHAASAVIFLWALWAVWWMRPIAIAANIGMLLATPYIGGHYFIDVFAGIAIAIVSIGAARAASRWLTRPEARIAPAPFLPPVVSEPGSARTA